MVTRTTRKRRAKLFRSALFTGMYLIVLFVLLRTIGLATIAVESSVLSPTIRAGDRILVLPVKTFNRGDLILFQSPMHKRMRIPGTTFALRRIIPTESLHSRPPVPGSVLPGSAWTIRAVAALPGDTVVIGPEDILVIAGDERFRYSNASPVPPEAYSGIRQLRLAQDELFLLATDDAFLDSREWGVIPTDLVRARLSFRYWPLNRIGPI